MDGNLRATIDVPGTEWTMQIHRTLLIASVLAIMPFSGRAQGLTPNVVLIYADDLGYGDLGCYGNSRIPTPNCDRLASEGVRFTHAYAAASVCTPSRYALLTGRYPWRTWLKKGVVGNTPALIEEGRYTLANVFRDAGYATAAVGKWHLGFGDRHQKDLDWNAELTGGPCDIGFDYFFGMPVSHFYPPYVYVENRRVYNLDPDDPLSLDSGKPGLPVQHGGASATYKPEEVGKELADRACRYIRENRDRRFFLYYAAIEPHTPFTPHPDYVGRSQVGAYGDFVVQFDDGVGHVLAAVQECGLAQDTIVILTSDNGGISRTNGHMLKHGLDYDPNVPLRGDKGDFLEGGLRIPFIVRWPGIVKPNTRSDEVICQTDLLKTFADLLGVDIPEGAGEDSADVLAALRGESSPERPVVLQSRNGFHALQRGEWIYLDHSTNGDLPADAARAPRVETQGQLYHLSEDLHQDRNLYESDPDRVSAMREALRGIRDRAGPAPPSRDVD